MIHAVAYYGKLAIHPVPLTSLVDIWERAAKLLRDASGAA
jgi:hypothetical protein